jgi:NAD(P)-dependent dehydrogenase (short-subunit alcohol dehydrogenase family)
MSQHDHALARRRFLSGIALATSAVSLGLAQRVGAQTPGTGAAQPAPLRDVAGKVAFITGGSSGIGLGQARVFHDAGMKVVIGYIREDQLDSALAQFKTDRNRVHAIKVNVVDRDAMAAAADEIEARFGKIHLLSNNAGIGPLMPLSATDYAAFDQTLAINLTGVFNGVHTFLPRIRKHGEGGHIVTTSSMSGILPTEGGGAGAYTTTKFGVVGMMEALRSEMDTAKTGVGVSVYCPGLVNTNIFELEKNVSATFNPNAPRVATGADAAANEARIRSIIGNGMDPIEAAQIVLAGIRANDLHILSHPEFAEGLAERHEAIMAALPYGKKAPEERLKTVAGQMHNSLYVRERAKRLAARRKV